jgi:hypothetical protein
MKVSEKPGTSVPRIAIAILVVPEFANATVTHMAQTGPVTKINGLIGPACLWSFDGRQKKMFPDNF